MVPEPSTSVVDRHRLDADPGSDPNFNFDANPDPDPDWHQNDADPHAGPIPSFTHIKNLFFFITYSHTIACSQRLPFSSVSKVFF